MPIYEYVCEKCGSLIEVIQKVSDERLKRCRSCRGKLEKVVSRTSFQLKGSGWYLTDYSRSNAESASKDSKDKTEKTDKSESKKEAKSSADGACGSGGGGGACD